MEEGVGLHVYTLCPVFFLESFVPPPNRPFSSSRNQVSRDSATELLIGCIPPTCARLSLLIGCRGFVLLLVSGGAVMCWSLSL